MPHKAKTIKSFKIIYIISLILVCHLKYVRRLYVTDIIRLKLFDFYFIIINYYMAIFYFKIVF